MPLRHQTDTTVECLPPALVATDEIVVHQMNGCRMEGSESGGMHHLSQQHQEQIIRG